VVPTLLFGSLRENLTRATEPVTEIVEAIGSSFHVRPVRPIIGDGGNCWPGPRTFPRVAPLYCLAVEKGEPRDIPRGRRGGRDEGHGRGAAPS
jgi:hypothetical protein